MAWTMETWRGQPFTFRRGPVPGINNRRYFCGPILWDRALAPWWAEYRRCKANKRMSSQIMRARYRQEDRREMP